MAKSMGGVGRKITGKTLRRFMPNIQSVKTLVDGKAKKVNACAKCLKAGKAKK
jgi:large subunit ribosomal protein L28